MNRNIFVIILIGLFITAYGIYITYDQIKFSGNSVIANAVVAGFHEETGSKGRIAYFPVFQFVNGITGEMLQHGVHLEVTPLFTRWGKKLKSSITLKTQQLGLLLIPSGTSGYFPSLAFLLV